MDQRFVDDEQIGNSEADTVVHQLQREIHRLQVALLLFDRF
jgi:hypothetical protein